MNRPNSPLPLKLSPELPSVQRSTSEDQISKVEQESNIIQHMMSVPNRHANNTRPRHVMAARAQSPQRMRDGSSLAARSVAVDEASGRVPNRNANNTQHRHMNIAGSQSQRHVRDGSTPGELDEDYELDEYYGRTPTRNAINTQTRYVRAGRAQSPQRMRDGISPGELGEYSGRVPNRNASDMQARHGMIARSQSQRNMTSVPNRNADNAQYRHMNLARGQSQRRVRDGSLPGIFVALGEDSPPPRPKTLFGPYGILDQPTTNDEAKNTHAKERTGLKKWADKIKGAAGEWKADLKSVVEELRDVAGELVTGLPAHPRRQSDKSMDGYASAQLTTTFGGQNERFTHFSDDASARANGIIGFPLLNPLTRPASPTKRPLPKISLAPPIQARLFSELELVLTKTINDYLLGEKMMGRMSDASLEKVVKGWMAKGRPLPNEFYFDLTAQLELFHANLNTFRFFGQHQGSYLHIQSMLNGWSSLAKKLNRRTLSTPDSDIKKYLVDIDNILNLLGVDQKVWTEFGYWRDATLQALSGKAREEEVYGSQPWGIPMVSMPPSRGPEETFDDQNIVETGLRLLKGHRND
ncbi:hypothetical protein MMC30_003713 [Trapelia coarctata]|nr:hypothetical protein [Trapelia coarctata]